MKPILIITALILYPFICFSQVVLQDKKFTNITKDNTDNYNGAYASLTIEYMVRSLGKNEVYFATSVADFTINATQGFGYKNKIYRSEVPGLTQALEIAKPKSPTVIFKIYYAGNVVATRTESVTAVNNLNAFSGDGFAIPATEQQIKNPNWLMEAVELKSFFISPDDGKYGAIISKYLNQLETSTAYKKQITVAEKAFSIANTKEGWLEARSAYNKASAIAPAELDPPKKIEFIDKKISSLDTEEKNKAAEKKLQEEEESKRKKEEEAKKNETELEKIKNDVEEQKKGELEKKKAAEKKVIKPKTEQEIEDFNQRNRKSSALEIDGDNLANSDAIAAKEKYEQAQLYNYTYRVEQKIKNLQINLQVQAGFKAIKGVDQLTEQLDPNGNTRFSLLFSGYDGLIADHTKLDKSYNSKPWNLTFFGIRLSALFLALELRLGYFNSPYYKFDVENNKNPSVVIDKVGIQQQALSTGLSAGLNFHIKRFNIYGLYGAEWLGLNTSKIMEGGNYSFKDDAGSVQFPQFAFVLSTGIDFNIPIQMWE